MKLFIQITCLLTFVFNLSYGQIIYTVDSVGLYDIGSVIFDKLGNIYFNSPLGNQIGKIDTNHIVTFIAGNGTYGFSGDGGPATAAELAQPQSVVLDTNNNLYFADQQNHRIRKVNLTTGLISTVVGSGPAEPSSGGFSGDNGPASAAQLYYPDDIKMDKEGNLYIADSWNYRVRKVDTTGIITTVAGNGIAGKIGNGSPATNAELYYPYFLAVDIYDNIYVASPDHTIRKINCSTGIINAFAGDTSSDTYNGDNILATTAYLEPTLMTFNAQGLLVVSDEGNNNRVRLIDSNGYIHTIAGDGTFGNSGDGGPADSAELYGPSGVAYDHCGNLYIAQVDDPRIRKVFFNPSCLPLSTPQVLKNEVHIYPNPTDNVLNIDGVSTGTRYVLLNITGITEQRGTLKQGNNSLSLQPLPPGIYLLQLTDNEGQKTISKIIKQ